MERPLRNHGVVIESQEVSVRKPAVLSGFLIILALSLAACGKSMSNSPMAPNAPAVSNSSSATLAGTVGGGSGIGLGATTSGSTAGMTISVVGSPATTTVDATGRFRLVITPSGNVQLKISGGGVDSTTTVGAVAAGDTIEITITVSGGTAEIEDTDHASGQSREIEGRVEAVPPTTAAGTFKVAGKTVATTASTIYKKSDGGSASFADVLLGSRVHVKAAPTTGTVITATEVNIQNEQTQLPVELNGTVSGFGGTALAFAFDIGSRHVTGDSTTEFQGNNKFSALRNGARVEVKGSMRSGAVFATRIHIEDAAVDDPNGGDGGTDHGREAEVSGAVSGLAGVCPAIHFAIGSTRVTTSSATRFELACSTIASATRVEVKGTRVADGSIAATHIKRD